MNFDCFLCGSTVEEGDEVTDTAPDSDPAHRDCFKSTWGDRIPGSIIDDTYNIILTRKDIMSLPSNDEFIETIFKCQKYVAVTGHCQEIGVPSNTEAYRMNIKLDLDVELSPEQHAQFTQEVFDAAVVKAKHMWPWIDGIFRAGKNKGWAVITKNGPGVNEWNNDYRRILEEDDHDEDILGVYWMLIQKRHDDLDAIAEFTRDEVKTAERYVHEWLLKNK